jgi:hypothetical protein
VLLYGHFPQPGPAKCDIAFLLARGGAAQRAACETLPAGMAATALEDCTLNVLLWIKIARGVLTLGDRGSFRRVEN